MKRVQVSRPGGPLPIAAPTEAERRAGDLEREEAEIRDKSAASQRSVSEATDSERAPKNAEEKVKTQKAVAPGRGPANKRTIG